MVSKHTICRGMNRKRDERGSTLVIALCSVAILMALGGYAMRLTTQRMATVSQASAWQRAYYLAESGVDIARATLKTASVDPTVWTTQTFPIEGGTPAV